MSLARASLILFEADARQRGLRRRVTAEGGEIAVARHAHERLRLGHDPHEVARDAHRASPAGHKRLLDDLHPSSPHRDAVFMAPKLDRFAQASMKQDTVQKEREKADQLPQTVRNSRKMKNAAAEKHSAARKDHHEARNDLMPMSAGKGPAQYDTSIAEARRASRHLKRGYFPEGAEGDRHHLRAVSELHYGQVESEQNGSTTISGVDRSHIQELHRTLQHHGYDKTHDLKYGLGRIDPSSEEGWGDHVRPSRLAQVTMTPKKNS